MAESQKGYGRIQGDSSFEFSLDGLASYSQLKKLISLTESMAKTMGADTAGPTKEEKEEVDLLKDKNRQTSKSIDLEEEKYKSSQELDRKFRDLTKTTEFFKGNLASAGYGYTTSMTLLTTGVGTIVGALSGYADQLQLGLQRGISGGIMDFAIAAKTGGVSLGAFSKALEESGGGFASLGVGATEGAKNFGALIGSVRGATASVGNLGLSNEQLAMFTAQQVKVATAQGFKGRVAQEVVINNSRALAKELDTLANQTGKSVLEMTQAAIKLAQDPLVSSFVRDIKTGGADVAKSLNSYAANFSALFGKEGDKIARDTLGPALAGLPMIINDTGKNMALASQSTYNEMNRLALKAKSGEQMTDEDRQRLSDTIKQEMKTRGSEIRMMSELGGPLGDSAKQFLSLAQEVEYYNSAAGEQRRKEDKAAQEFNTAMNQFKANIMALSIPFLKLINGIPWDTFIKTLTTFVDVLGFLLTPFAKLGTVLGGTGAGSLIAVVGGVASALLVAKTGYDLLTGVLKNLTGTTTTLDSVFKKLQATLSTPGGTLSGGLGDISKGGGPGDLSKDNSKKDTGKGRAKSAGKSGEYGKGFGAIAENAAQRKAEEINKARELAEAQTKKITDNQWASRTAELKNTNPNISSADALKTLRSQDAAKAASEAAKDAAEKQSKQYKVGNTVGGIYGKASRSLSSGIETLGNSKIGGALGSGKFTVGSWLGSAALDSGANALKENGYGLAGGAVSTASGALAGASTGAMLGSLFGPGGAAVGAIGGALIGGISTAFSEYQKSETADGLADADAAAVDQSNQYQSQSLDQQKAMARELRQLREDMGYGNAIASRQIAVTETGNRQISNLQYAQ
jgi:hypothetical protein